MNNYRQLYSLFKYITVIECIYDSFCNDDIKWHTNRFVNDPVKYTLDNIITCCRGEWHNRMKRKIKFTFLSINCHWFSYCCLGNLVISIRFLYIRVLAFSFRVVLFSTMHWQARVCTQVCIQVSVQVSVQCCIHILLIFAHVLLIWSLVKFADQPIPKSL
jgi:hypothetical protein